MNCVNKDKPYKKVVNFNVTTVTKMEFVMVVISKCILNLT